MVWDHEIAGSNPATPIIFLKMKKEIVEGIVIEALPDTTFKVQLKNGGEVLAYLSGKMRINYIKIVPGDEVVVELSPYDKRRGRIIKRK